MIERSHGLSITRQAQLLRISRGTVYYQCKQPGQGQQQFMDRPDALHVAHSFAGSRMLCTLLQRQGHSVGRTRIRTLMQRMCLQRCTASLAPVLVSGSTRSTHTCCATSL